MEVGLGRNPARSNSIRSTGSGPMERAIQTLYIPAHPDMV